jgi:hypothetical protein
MKDPMRPVIVFHAQNEFEAQVVRDALVTAMVPVIHVPSLSTGIFGVPQTLRVAVPHEYVEQALQALQEAGFEGEASELPKGIGAFREAMEDRLPRRAPSFTESSSLARVLIGLAVIILALIVIVFVRSA